jgi:hypothetical protein
MIISLFMNPAPLRRDDDGSRAGTDVGPAGQKAGELPYRERQEHHFDHRHDPRCSTPRDMRGSIQCSAGRSG